MNDRKESLHRIVRHEHAENFLWLGWMPAPSLNGTHHGEWSVHLVWLCDCAPPEPTEDAIDIAITQSRLAEIQRWPERLQSL